MNMNMKTFLKCCYFFLWQLYFGTQMKHYLKQIKFYWPYTKCILATKHDTKTHSTDISFLFTPLQLLHATHKIVALPPTRFHFEHWNIWFFICADKFVAVLMPYKIYKMSLHILN